MGFDYLRIIRFGETDAAGVMYFAVALQICHEAYEASLAATGIDLVQFFSPSGQAVPVVHVQANYFLPLRCGDDVEIGVKPTQIAAERFAISYRLYAAKDCRQLLATAETQHVAIDPESRAKVPLSPELLRWLQRWG